MNRPMQTFYATMTPSHMTHHQIFPLPKDGRCGYVEIIAVDQAGATAIMMSQFDDKWSMMYSSLDKMHHYDQVKLGTLRLTFTQEDR